MHACPKIEKDYNTFETSKKFLLSKFNICSKSQYSKRFPADTFFRRKNQTSHLSQRLFDFAPRESETHTFTGQIYHAASARRFKKTSAGKQDIENT